MIEEIFNFSTGDRKVIEKVIGDENIDYMHMIFNKDQGLPEHYSNSNVYMSVLRGKLSIQLDAQDIHEYTKGDVLKIPYNTQMNVNNFHEDALELIVIKSPAPKNYPK